MSRPAEKPGPLPTRRQVHRAIELYLARAYGGAVPPSVQSLVAPAMEEAPPEVWLMGEGVERSPEDAALGQVRAFALRLGSDNYRHIKLRLVRPPKSSAYVFCVDCHDQFLRAPPGSPDYEALEKLKCCNAELATEIMAALDEANLPTERRYLRMKIREARTAGAGDRADASASPDGATGGCGE